VLETQQDALDAIIWLPDYLMEEAMSGSGATLTEDYAEFTPSILYMEQMLRIFPREISAKWRLLPAFEESFMRMEEAKNADDS